MSGPGDCVGGGRGKSGPSAERDHMHPESRHPAKTVPNHRMDK